MSDDNLGESADSTARLSTWTHYWIRRFMDDRLKQAADCRRKRSLLFAILTCISVELHGEQEWFMQELIEPSSVTQTSHASSSSRGPQFVQEPEEVQSLPWAPVAAASITAPITPPALVQVPPPSKPALGKIPAAVQTKPAPVTTPVMTASSRKRAESSEAWFVDFASLESVNEVRSNDLSSERDSLESPSAIVLPGISIAALRQSAARSLDDADDRLQHRASLSATAAATQALKLIAQSHDLSQGNGSASTELDSALTAIREADDFAGRYGLVDTAAISRMVPSHETKALKGFNTSQLTGIIAADIYLDSARQKLSAIAAADPLAAHALGLLAKSYRQRAAESPLALATSVHLMRAAVCAAPRDRELAMEFASVLQQANMVDEARAQQAYIAQLPTTNEHESSFRSDGVIAVVTGTAVRPDQAQSEQAIRIEQISPEAFAGISKAEAGPSAPANASSPRTTEAANDDAAKPIESRDPNKSEGNVVTRAFKTMTRIWR